ncbi:hypothetical protein NQ042_12135 [Corynebacterium phoceense]|uniref:hypothetical protein n=1 Tax=Corynebacterium phoceense TaxID=1686286 RepID=UPI00211C003B|nr:hypothetical protein [Corynebacterium phoceense]MCQ9334813.1 hypothetical protein [Corynebacterium phoceense]
MSGSLRGSGTRQRGGTGRMVAAVVLLVRSGGSLHRLRPRRVSQALGLRRLFDLLGDTITFQSVTGSEKDEFFRNPEVVSSFYSSLGVVTGAQQLQELEAAAVHRDQDDGAYTYELDAFRLP